VKKKAKEDGRHLIAFTLMSPLVTPLVRNTLFHRLNLSIEPLDISTLEDSFPSWLSITVRLAQRAGGIPWDLMNLPGVDENTVFLGIDLGHNHKEDKSNLAMTLFDHQGRGLNPIFRTSGESQLLRILVSLLSLPQTPSAASSRG
jgi:hypothetical protein